MTIALIGGGVRCGKSAFALALARKLGEQRLFIATAEALDSEMSARIAAHRAERGADFATLEEPLALAEAIEHSSADVIIVDCLTLWLSNLLLRECSDAQIEARVTGLAHALQARRAHSVLVSNEVGMGVVPESALGRRFRDCAGRAHQQLAALADHVYFGALGSMLRLRPGPICLQRPEDIDVTDQHH
jgi:adenosylcobinamide kinase / adenosylcobinamide-phosphate guanylyltransferase